MHHDFLDFPDEHLADESISCTTCGRTLWTRGHPCADLQPCPHLLLFTDCESELRSWCDPKLLAWARAKLVVPEDEESAMGDPLGPEGWLHAVAGDLLELLPRPDDPPVYAVTIEGEYSTGLLVTRAAVRVTR